MEHLKLNTNVSIAKFLAFNVESSINKLHDSINDNKGYLNKAKSLAYNIKKNEVYYYFFNYYYRNQYDN